MKLLREVCIEWMKFSLVKVEEQARKQIQVTVQIQPLLKVTIDLISIYYNCLSGAREVHPDDFDQTFDQLVELCDVLEKLFKALATNGPHSLGTGLSVGLLSRCKDVTSEIETALKQEIDRKGSSSSVNPQVILSGFASALRGVIAENQRYVYRSPMLTMYTKALHQNQCRKFSGLYKQ